MKSGVAGTASLEPRRWDQCSGERSRNQEAFVPLEAILVTDMPIQGLTYRPLRTSIGWPESAGYQSWC